MGWGARCISGLQKSWQPLQATKGPRPLPMPPTTAPYSGGTTGEPGVADGWYLRQDGYTPRSEIPASMQIGNYAAPLATVHPLNTLGMRRHDGVEDLQGGGPAIGQSGDSWNAPPYLWYAPMRGNINVLTAGRAENPIASYNATLAQAQGVPPANRPAWVATIQSFLAGQGTRGS